MGRPRMRPLFKLVLKIERRRLMEEIERRLDLDSDTVTGTVLRKHVDLTIHGPSRHFWSPHLHLDAFQDDDETTTLRGRFAPHPDIWTLLMGLYGLIVICAIAGGVYGASQSILQRPPTGLIAIPMAGIAAAGVFLTAEIGKKLAQDQMHELREFFESCVSSVRPPPLPGGADTTLDTTPTRAAGMSHRS